MVSQRWWCGEPPQMRPRMGKHRVTYIKFWFRLGQPGDVCTIHKEDDAIDGREVVFPHSPGCCEQTWTKTKWFYSLIGLLGRHPAFTDKTYYGDLIQAGRRVRSPMLASCCQKKNSIILSLAAEIVNWSKTTTTKNISIQNTPCAWPPRSKVVNVMPAIVNSSEAGGG